MEKEYIFSEALKHMDEGKTEAEILRIFPHEKKELNEMFGTIAFLKREKAHIMLNKTRAQQLFEAIKKKELVTDAVGYSYSRVEGNAVGRISHKRITLNKMFESIITSKRWIPLGTIAVFIVILAITQTGSSSKEEMVKLAATEEDTRELDPLNLNMLEQELAEIQGIDAELAAFFEEEEELLEAESALQEY